MPANPLFVSTIQDLKEKIRLGNMPTDSAGHKVLEEAILSVRIWFQARLGSARITQLLGYPFKDSPGTPQEYERALANITEVKAVRLEMLKISPMLFKDDSGSLHQVWNEEGIFRDATTFDIDAAIERHQNELESNMDILQLKEQMGSVFEGRVSSLEPDTDPWIPGNSIGLII